MTMVTEGEKREVVVLGRRGEVNLLVLLKLKQCRRHVATSWGNTTRESRGKERSGNKADCLIGCKVMKLGGYSFT